MDLGLIRRALMCCGRETTILINSGLRIIDFISVAMSEAAASRSSLINIISLKNPILVLGESLYLYTTLCTKKLLSNFYKEGATALKEDAGQKVAGSNPGAGKFSLAKSPTNIPVRFFSCFSVGIDIDIGIDIAK